MKRLLVVLALLCSTGTVTHAQIYSSQIHSSTGAVVPAISLCHNFQESKVTVGTSEEILETCTIPAGALSVYGGFELSAQLTGAANAHSKSAQTRIGGISGTVMNTATSTTSAEVWDYYTRCVVSASNSLSCYSHNLRTSAASTQFYAYTLTPLTFSNSFDLVVTGTTGSAAGELTLTGLQVSLFPR